MWSRIPITRPARGRADARNRRARMSRDGNPGRPGDAGLRVLQPAHWPRPKGYANGMIGRGRMVFVGGMVGWNEAGEFAGDFVAQTRQALQNILTVLAEAQT